MKAKENRYYLGLWELGNGNYTVDLGLASKARPTLSVVYVDERVGVANSTSTKTE